MASVSDDVALTMDDMPLGEGDRRNGYRERRLRTVIGEIVLRVPKLREDTYFPELVTRPYSRVGRAMVGVVSRAYVNGMSARRIEKVAGGLEFGRSGPSTASRMLASLDGEVDALRQGEFDAGSPVPYLWLDAAYVKCRDDDSCVCSRATVTAIGAFMDGTRRFVGFDLVDTESYDSWKRFLPSLRKRGVGGVRLVTSDAHAGLRRAVMDRIGLDRPASCSRTRARTRWPIWRSTGSTGSDCASTTCLNAPTPRSSDAPAPCGSSPHASP